MERSYLSTTNNVVKFRKRFLQVKIAFSLYSYLLFFLSLHFTLCTRDTINYLTSESDTTRRGAWRKMESGELTIILILQVFMRGSLGQELAEK